MSSTDYNQSPRSFSRQRVNSSPQEDFATSDFYKQQKSLQIFLSDTYGFDMKSVCDFFTNGDPLVVGKVLGYMRSHMQSKQIQDSSFVQELGEPKSCSLPSFDQRDYGLLRRLGLIIRCSNNLDCRDLSAFLTKRDILSRKPIGENGNQLPQKQRHETHCFTLLPLFDQPVLLKNLTSTPLSVTLAIGHARAILEFCWQFDGQYTGGRWAAFPQYVLNFSSGKILFGERTRDDLIAIFKSQPASFNDLVFGLQKLGYDGVPGLYTFLIHYLCQNLKFLSGVHRGHEYLTSTVIFSDNTELTDKLDNNHSTITRMEKNTGLYVTVSTSDTGVELNLRTEREILTENICILPVKFSQIRGRNARI